MTTKQKSQAGLTVAFLEIFAGIFLGICISLYAGNIVDGYVIQIKLKTLDDIQPLNEESS